MSSLCPQISYTAYDDWLRRRHNEREGVSNRRRLDCLLNRLFRRRSKKSSKLRVTGLCEGNPQVTGGFPSPRASNAENVSIWWRHRDNGKIRYISLLLRRVCDYKCFGYLFAILVKSFKTADEMTVNLAVFLVLKQRGGLSFRLHEQLSHQLGCCWPESYWINGYVWYIHPLKEYYHQTVLSTCTVFWVLRISIASVVFFFWYGQILDIVC